MVEVNKLFLPSLEQPLTLDTLWLENIGASALRLYESFSGSLLLSHLHPIVPWFLLLEAGFERIPTFRAVISKW